MSATPRASANFGTSKALGTVSPAAQRLTVCSDRPIIFATFSFDSPRKRMANRMAKARLAAASISSFIDDGTYGRQCCKSLANCDNAMTATIGTLH